MRPASIALLLVLRLALLAQDEDRKPSPFPEKNREREAAAKRASASPRPKRTRAGSSRTEANADRADVTAAQRANIGKACFFSSKPGSATASGEDPNPDEFVAAHATHALGSHVLVTNLANGKAIEVRIIDRLPDPRRIISVSEAAARQLGFYDAGITTVKVEALNAGEARR